MHIGFYIKPNGKNKNITNYEDLKQMIFRIKNVRYINSYETSMGKCYWGLIPISDPAEHKAHFKAIERMFEKFRVEIQKFYLKAYQLDMYMFDQDALFRHDAVIFKSKVDENGSLYTTVSRNEHLSQNSSALL